MVDYIPNNLEKKKLKKEVDSFISKFKDLKNVKFFVGGSYAKGTWLPGNRDVDVFVKFNCSKFSGKDISLELFNILSKKFKDISVVHGSRDYYHILVNDLLFEVVPVLDIGRNISKAENIMDFSPLHVSYVKKKLRNKNDVRKLKALLKAQNLYGAESYVSGFSGYVLELLICYYGSFSNLIKKAKSWSLEREVIDVGRKYNSKEMALKFLNKSKISSLVLIDPVDKSRNCAAALSSGKYKEFVKLCKNYDGSDSWFVAKEVDVSKLKGYIVLSVEPLDGKKDVVLAKMKALYSRFLREFKYNGFNVLDSGWDSSHYWFKVGKLKSKYKHYGPSVSMEEHVKAFKKKYKNVKVSRSRVYVELKRENVDPLVFVKKLIKRKFVREKVKKISI